LHYTHDGMARAARHRARVCASIIGLLCAFAAPASALELGGSIGACHDPSRIIEAGGRYYVFSTAPNINLRSSADLVTWQWEPRVFDYASGMPPWMDAIASGDNLWAPDVIERPSGGFLTFYSRNLDAGAGERSVCGVATSPAIDGPFTDGQAVLDVTLLGDYYRVIDPAPIYDQSGQLWLAVGSFGAPNANGYANGGIRVFRLDAQTGKLVTAGDDGTRIAGSWIEAAFLHYHAGYYYLFFNEAACCRGLDSTYFIRVGRSANVTGPYTDMAGDSLLTPTSGGSLFMGRQFAANFTGSDTNATPRANCGSVGRELGPGHAAISRLSDGIERLSYHYYDAATANGEPTLGVKSVLWGVDGWRYELSRAQPEHRRVLGSARWRRVLGNDGTNGKLRRGPAPAALVHYSRRCVSRAVEARRTICDCVDRRGIAGHTREQQRRERSALVARADGRRLHEARQRRKLARDRRGGWLRSRRRRDCRRYRYRCGCPALVGRRAHRRLTSFRAEVERAGAGRR
jgi:arabinan endo-1,5-alpha-L-arabinosidase